MRVAKYVAVIAAAACLSTSAMAGGFSFTSAGGNAGKWSYADGAAFGGAECVGVGKCHTDTGYTVATATSAGHQGSGAISTGGDSSNASGYGFVSAQSHAGGVAGSGSGFGAGFKLGSFTLQCGCR
jgi:hypothetical protein